ncbi:MAG: flagellar type III secretion system pore protein FliP [Defluviitaleaceae bacterium]|nr:flagellar type III secretion system pore protein FliP [Defluviitaleaceae bacterium]
MPKRRILKASAFSAVFFLCFAIPQIILAMDATVLPGIEFSVMANDDPTQVVTTLQILFLFTLIALAPSFLLMTTCFTRVLIAMHFVRAAMGTQQMPPNQVMVSIALFISLFLMGPTLDRINTEALQPYSAGQLSQADAITRGMDPLRDFMIRQAEEKDIALFLSLAGMDFTTYEEVPTRVLIPAFILGELTKGFKFGVIIYLPFIAIDMVVASVLMAMGMMMLPPAMISLPFKILLFVMVDGWSMVIENLIRTFY